MAHIKAAIATRPDGTRIPLVFIAGEQHTTQQAYDAALKILQEVDAANARIETLNEIDAGIQKPFHYTIDGITSLTCQHCHFEWTSKAKPGNVIQCPECRKHKRIPKGTP
jgi:rubrerythrin